MKHVVFLYVAVTFLTLELYNKASGSLIQKEGKASTFFFASLHSSSLFDGIYLGGFEVSVDY